MQTLLARLLLIVAVALVPPLAFQAYTEFEAREIRKRLVDDEALRMLRLVAADQQRIAEGAEQVLDTISFTPAIQDLIPDLCLRLLASVVQRSPRYVSAAVFGLDGRYICGPAHRPASLNVSDRAYFRRALQTGCFVIGEYAVGRGSGKPTLHMAKPLRNQDGVVVGVIEVGIGLDWLGRQIDRLDLPPGTIVTMFDSDGIILARRPFIPGLVGRTLIPEDRFILEGNEVALGTIKGLDGKPEFIAYSPPGAEPKGLLIKIALDPVTTFAGVTQANRTGLVLIIAAAGLALAITALLGTPLIRRPVARLLGTAERWRTGDLAARTGLHTDRSEFGRLAAAFDAMATALHAREHALRTALESTTDGVMVFDRDWRFTYLNERAKAVLAPGRDLLGRVIWDVFPDAEGSLLGNAYREAMERGEPTQATGPCSTIGSCFEAHAYPSDDGLTVFFDDVAEIRRIAAALQQSEELFRATFDQAAVGMAQTGLDGAWLRVNDKLCEITGYRRDDLLGHFFHEITHPDDLDGDLERTRALLAGEIATFSLEKRYLRRDGGVVWVNLTVSLLHDADGRPTCFIAVIEDITARKRAEAALEARTHTLHTALESTTDSVMVIGRDWRITYLSERAKAHVTHGRDIVGQTLWEAFPQTRDSVFGEAYRAAMESGVPTHKVGYSAAFDGWFEAHAYPSNDSLTVFFRDISEERRIAAALAESQSRLRLAQEAAGIGIWEYDFASHALTWSPEQYRLHGLDPAAGPPTYPQWLDLVDPEDRPPIRCAETAFKVSGAESLWLEFRIRRGSDGAIRWLASLGRVVRDEAGRPGRIVGVNFDITERRQAEEDLRRATALLRAIGTCSPDPIYAKDAEGRFMFANPALLAVIGKTAEEVIGRTDADWHNDPAQAAAVMANDRRVIQSGSVEILEEVFEAAGLGPRVFRSAKAPLRADDGSVVGVIGVSSDITNLKDAKEALRRLSSDLEARVREEVAAREAAQARAAQAERLQALGLLAGGIAHDFNNVLQAVAGAAAMIELRPGDAAGVRRCARVAIEATDRGAAVTRRLLAFGRRADLRAERFDVTVLLNDLREMLGHTLGAGIDVQVRLQAGLPALFADKRQLETALINLATNARDAMPEGGRLSFLATTEAVFPDDPGHPSGLAPGRYLRLAVADTGTGMDAATLERVGEPFFTTKGVGVGTGLGLPMAKGFAEQSGGALSIESRPGKGTTVTLWLPEADGHSGAVAAQGAPDPAKSATGTPPPSACVLLVDDETLVRMTIGEYLESSGLRVVQAATGAEALALLEAGEAVDVLVTDLSMPGMDGMAVIQAAQQGRPGLPAMLLTGYADTSAAFGADAAAGGVFLLVRKPVSGNELVERILALVAGQRR